jgi:geranylgeranyl pyrophosphate synthase
MMTSSVFFTVDGFVSDVRRRIKGLCEYHCVAIPDAKAAWDLSSGKMLRTRFAARLLAACGGDCPHKTVQNACAATEITHTASLLHDDIIDNAALRRSQPALWKSRGSNYAVLAGDLLYLAGLSCLIADESQRYIRLFVQKVQEVCKAEIHQELISRETSLDVDVYLAVIRNKTGPFFAFLGYVCGNKDFELSKALEEAGYRIGTAYQIVDDMIDIMGMESRAGKTLGTDAARQKQTLPALFADDPEAITETVNGITGSAFMLLQRWPAAQKAVMDFVSHDLLPAVKPCLREPARTGGTV